MWTKVTNPQQRDAFVRDYMLRKGRFRQLFEDEKLGDMSAQIEAAKLFQPIIGETAAQRKDIQKVTRAIEQLPAQIAEESNFNPIAQLFEPLAIEAKAMPPL